MESLLFCVMHHSTTKMHTDVFENCIKSIKKFHPNNRILIVYTSKTVIPKYILDYNNVLSVQTPVDGSTIYGAMQCLLAIVNMVLTNVTNYIIMHDSMFLLKSLPELIIERRFYYLWYFNSAYHDHKDLVIHSICNNNFDHENKIKLLNKYQNLHGAEWGGLFGPAFGGNIDTLRHLYYAMDINDKTLHNYIGREHIMAAERYIALIASHLGIIDPIPNTYALNGSIENHPYKFTKMCSDDMIQKIIDSNYDAYMGKIWLIRP